MTPRCARPTWAKASPDSAHLISRVVLFLSRCLILSRGPDKRMGRAGGILPCCIFFLAPIIEATSAKKTTRSQEHLFSTSGHWDFHQRSRCCRFGGKGESCENQVCATVVVGIRRCRFVPLR